MPIVEADGNALPLLHFEQRMYRAGLSLLFEFLSGIPVLSIRRIPCRSGCHAKLPRNRVHPGHWYCGPHDFMETQLWSTGNMLLGEDCAERVCSCHGNAFRRSSSVHSRLLGSQDAVVSLSTEVILDKALMSFF